MTPPRAVLMSKPSASSGALLAGADQMLRLRRERHVRARRSRFGEQVVEIVTRSTSGQGIVRVRMEADDVQAEAAGLVASQGVADVAQAHDAEGLAFDPRQALAPACKS